MLRQSDLHPVGNRRAGPLEQKWQGFAQRTKTAFEVDPPFGRSVQYRLDRALRVPFGFGLADARASNRPCRFMHAERGRNVPRAGAITMNSPVGFRPDAAAVEVCSVPVPTRSLVPCDLCGGNQFELVDTLDRNRQPLETVICRGCGLVRHAQVPTEDELARFYARHYRRQYHGEQSPSVRRVVRAWRNGLRIFGQLRPWLRKGMRVLEIGAGIGATVKVFQLHGTDAHGIDPGEGFCRWGQEHLRARLRCQRLEQLPADGSWDLVLLVHVIEHLRQPRQALERIRQLLAPEGLLYVECPNLTAPLARPGRCFHQAHIYNFTPRTLQQLALRAGFAPVKQFSEDGDPNLQLLLRRGAAQQPPLDPHYWIEVLARMNRYGTFRYHLRAEYLRRRWSKCREYLFERVYGRRYLHGILRLCAGEDQWRQAAGLQSPLESEPVPPSQRRAA